jgi:hypothetical protein
LLVKPGVKGEVYYTTDGSEPDKNSQRYSKPFLIDKTTEVKVAIYIKKGDEERKFIRSQQFFKVENTGGKIADE